MRPFIIDVPVALIFFNRPDPLREVFAAIRDSRPSQLFLIQDGAREGRPDDESKIKQCRQIVQDIDWECEIHMDYSSVNLGCGMRIYSGITKCFESVDKLCIIEDDCLPSKGYFRFCAELLERYKDDERIDMISGMNNLETYDLTPYSYIFAKTGSIWGWATWRRAWKTIEYSMDFLNDPDAVRLLHGSITPKRQASELIRTGQEKLRLLQEGKKLSAWSYQRGMNMFLYSGLIIVPKKNLITNIGLTNDSVHSPNSIKKMPKALQSLYFMPTYELDDPLKHPKYIIQDLEFDRRLNRLMKPNWFIRKWRRFEGVLRRMIFN